jgi:hypothetical protein
MDDLDSVRKLRLELWKSGKRLPVLIAIDSLGVIGGDNVLIEHWKFGMGGSGISVLSAVELFVHKLDGDLMSDGETFTLLLVCF